MDNREQIKQGNRYHKSDQNIEMETLWAGHIARQKDDKWTREITAWYQTDGKRNREDK